ncbi:MAG: methionyl-tRNA formyltransferase [Verrucomicrobiota bacterium]
MNTSLTIRALPLVFMGTAEMACASLRALLQSDQFAVRAAVTQPDRPKGRDLKPQPSPVKKLALAAGLPLLQPEQARDPAFLKRLAEFNPEVIIVAAYGQMLPQSILDLPRLGCLNVHASLLPKYRGAAPIQWAILNNDPETGVTIMQMAAGLDTGGILSQSATPIGPDETAASLHDRLAVLGAELLVSTLPRYAAGEITPKPQDEARASYARKITKEDGRLDWLQSALALRNRVRAFTPWPGAYAFWTCQGRRRLLKIWRAQTEPRQGRPGEVLQADRAGLIIACGTDALRVDELQPESARRMSAPEFLAGHELPPGAFLE